MDSISARNPQHLGTNSMAIASLVCAFFLPLLAVIFGHVARSQIRRTGEQGEGMALAGLIMGYLWVAIGVIAVIAAIAVFLFGFGRAAY